MAHPTGESVDRSLRLDFDRRLMPQFRGSAVTSYAGLLAYRELDEAHRNAIQTASEGQYVFAKSGPTWDIILGGVIALAVAALGWLDIATVRSWDAADASIRQFGTLLTVLFGSLAALWWNQSARLPSTSADEDVPAFQSQRDANILNGAAATFTVISLFCSVFAGSPWGSMGSFITAIGVLIMLTFAGSDIRQAIPISLRLRLQLREISVAVLIVMGAAALLLHLEM